MNAMKGVLLFLTFFVIAASASAVNINSCQTLGAAGTTYDLTQNILNFAGGTCMTITANSVILDCHGYRIDGVFLGVGERGISVATVPNVVVRNCIVTDFDFGIVSYGNFNLIQNNTADNNIWAGITLNSTQDTRVINNRARNNDQDGIDILDGTHNDVLDNLVQANQWGISPQWSTGTKIGNNDINNGNDIGIVILSSTTSNVTFNRVTLNNLSGIAIDSASPNNLIYNNYFKNTANTDMQPPPSANQWNVGRQPGLRVYGAGNEIGGNYWTNPAGNGYSDLCADANVDGFCDTPFTITANNVDNLPLSNRLISGCTGINTPGTYNLISNIGSSGTCININSPNVVLDCKGKNITGQDITDSVGVLNPSYDNVVVQNCVITDYWAGIEYFNSADYGRIEGNTLTSNLYGVYLNGASGNVIRNNLAQGNGWDGIQLYNSANNNLLENNTLVANNNGVFLGLYAAYNNLTKNTFKENGDGAWVTWASGNRFFNNLFNNSVNVVFWLTPVYANEWNTARQPGTRIFSPGTEIGGNYWTSPGGGGVSDTCTDGDSDGFCDSAYQVDSVGLNFDYLPLSNKYVQPQPNTITSCPALITVPGDYQLGQSIGTAGTCITINASNVVLDCKGYAIDGDDTGTDYGVYNPGFDNVTVKNCKVTDFAIGIYYFNPGYNGADNGFIINNTATSNSEGIKLYWCGNNNVSNNNASDNTGTGIVLAWFSNQNNLRNNMALGNGGDGMYLQDSGGNNLTNNVLNANAYKGVYIYSAYGSGNRLTNNTVKSNGETGIRIDFSGGNILTNNTVNSNALRGIELGASGGNTVLNNAVSGQQYGIYLTGSGGNAITGNTASSNTAYGLYVTGSYDNTFANNIFSNNANANIYLEGPAQYAGECTGDTWCSEPLCSEDQYFCEEEGMCPGCSWQLGEPTYPAGNDVFDNNSVTGGSYGFDVREITANTFRNNMVIDNNDGIRFITSSGNNLFNNILSSNTRWDFSSSNGSTNALINVTTSQNLISFVCLDTNLKGLASGPADPPEYANIGKYLSINSTSGWINLNVSYTDAEIANVNESTLRMWRYVNGWTDQNFSLTNGVDMANNVVYAYITVFPGTYAPLGWRIIRDCTDGTPVSQCSATRPYYCNAGTLVPRCSTCGCPSLAPQCLPTGRCFGKTIRPTMPIVNE
ncbi:MAG: NosD domain-containing protein [Nanoarchaeota archaeon]